MLSHLTPPHSPGERTRWELSIADLESRLSKLPGDVVVASAFMSYAGPFPSEYRDELVGAKAPLYHTVERPECKGSQVQG